MAMIPPRMGHEQPLHPAPQVAVSMRPDHQMEVIGHQAIAQNVHGEPGMGLTDRLDEGVIIARFMKNLLRGDCPD